MLKRGATTVLATPTKSTRKTRVVPANSACAATHALVAVPTAKDVDLSGRKQAVQRLKQWAPELDPHEYRSHRRVLGGSTEARPRS